MRKKTVTYVADTIFWYLLYFLPILLTLVQSIGVFKEYTPVDWSTLHNGPFELLLANLVNLGIVGDGLIFGTIMSIFGQEGVLPLFTGDYCVVIPAYFSYFVAVKLVHLCVDFIIFIPNLAHKWLNKFTKECE